VAGWRAAISALARAAEELQNDGAFDWTQQLVAGSRVAHLLQLD